MAHNSLKGLDQSEQKFDGKGMRVAIVHTRWNQTVVGALVKVSVRSYEFFPSLL
jgi:6,7-dimethyl-8-ribityllumazine synthase